MSEIKKTAEGVIEVSATLSGDEWKNCRTKAIEILAKRVNIPGFRKGHAPLQLVESRINPSDLLDEMAHQGINVLYRKILTENKIRPYTQPSVAIDDINNDELKCTYTITTVPEVTLGKYKGIEIPLDEYNVTDKDVEDEINKLLDDNAELVLKDGPAELGDTVVLDFKGYMDGKEFDGGSAQNYSLVLGSNQFIPGFEEQLVGATPESKVDVNVTFPEQYIKDLAGKPAKFVCFIHEVKGKELPTLDDDFAKSLGIGGVENVEELKEYERKTLLKKKEQDARNAHFNKVLQAIVNDSQITIAEAVIQEEIEENKKNLNNQLDQNGLTYEQYKELTGMTDEKINDLFRQQSLTSLKNTLVLDKIAEVEGLMISQDELNAQYQRMATQYETDVDTIKHVYGETTSNNRLADNMLQAKIERFIIANNPPKEEVKEEKASKKKSTKKAAKEGAEKTTEATEEKKTKAKSTTKKSASSKKKKEEESNE